MIIVHGTFPVKADFRDEALELMKRMSVASRSEEGCISYEFYVGLSDINTLLLFQEWDNVDSLQAHFETEHMEEFLKVLPDVLDGDPTTRRYEVRGSGDGYEESNLSSDNLPDSEVREPRSRVEQRSKIVH